jgi:hypothetical protein
MLNLEAIWRARRRWVPVLTAILAALGVGIAVTVIDSDDNGRPDRIIIDLRERAPAPDPGAPPADAPGVDAADGELDGETSIGRGPEVAKPIVADADNEVDAGQEAKAGADPPVDVGPDIHEDARDESPAGAPPFAAEKAQGAAEALQLAEPRKPAGAQAHSCPNRFVRNFSAPTGREVQFVVHYTVSRPGSMNAIWGLFNTPSFGASSDLLLEPSGDCLRIVPRGRKAWTQGAFNGVSESVEIMAMGTEPRSWWLAQPIITHGILASIIRDELGRMGSPRRFVDPAGCAPRAGWTDHFHLECANDHHDVKPNFPYDVVARQVARGLPITINAKDRRACKAVHAYRERRRAHRPGTAAGRRNLERRLKRLRGRDLSCRAGKPIRR